METLILENGKLIEFDVRRDTKLLIIEKSG